MKLTSDELKTLYQQRTARSGRQRENCLSQETLLQAAAGTLSRVERQRVVDHLATCSDCAQEFRLVCSLRPWAEQAAAPFRDSSQDAKAGTARATQPGWLKALREHFASGPRWRTVSVAALIVVAAGATAIYWRTAGPGREVVQSERGDASPTTLRVEPPDKAVVRTAPARLAWSAMPSAESYQVVLYDRESTPIWESPFVTGAAIDVPEAVQQRLQRGQAIYWRVLAQTGIERRQSEVFQFVIER